MLPSKHSSYYSYPTLHFLHKENTTMSATLIPAVHGCRRTGSGRRNRTSKKKSSSNNSGLLKVVYISTPMKVKTSVSMFRSIVQELTGKYSDVAGYMENNVDFNEFNDDGVRNPWTVMSADDNHTEGKTHDVAITGGDDDDGILLANQYMVDQNIFQESPTTSDSLYSNKEHQFEFNDGSLDVLPVVDRLEGMFGSTFLMESTLDDITFEDFCLAA